MYQILVENLTKTYRVSERAPGWRGAMRGLVSRKTRVISALRGVSFRIGQGDLVGYIGPNGAGKSTTVKALSGILVPDSGRCLIDGRVPWEDRIAHVARIGVVFGQRTQLWWDLPVVESFDLLRDMYRVPGRDYRSRRDELVQRLGLEGFLYQPVRQLSLGQRMRSDLAAALLHRPGVLFLDEPTIGLDAVSKLAVRECIRDLHQRDGVTIILTTHDLDEIEALCQRVMVIGDGRILSDGTVRDLRRQVRDERLLTIDLCNPEATIDIPSTRIARREGGRVVLRFDPEEIPAAELIRRITAQHEIEDLFLESTPIEEIVANLYAKHTAEGVLL
ncbi:MAG TPA: ATP-binding cassette domain-containing protein [Chthoniobacterales bacterium]